MTTDTTITPDTGSAREPDLLPLDKAMSAAFGDYAMSVITARALPDVRDGCKPVHRRILWAMHEAGNTYSKAYKKSARMVGDVIGKYHPHGDVSVYDAAVRMAQPFSLQHVMIDGQGNFGSIDGDSPAAMRYTEMRLSRLAGIYFDDIHKDTVAWRDNYDGSEREPQVLPSPYPALLVNGSEGIAVGMANVILPHNLRAVIDTTLLLMQRSDAETAEIVGVMKAPDFPTGAIVHGLDGFAEAVESGRGKVKLRAKWHEEERARGAKAIVIDELPYQVNKSTLVEKIAALVRASEIDDVSDLRDESSKEGIRIWIGLKKDASPEAVFASLCAKTDLECSYSYNCVVLAGGRPRLMGLRQIILEWVAFREEVVLARHVWERKQALARMHILAGYMAALQRLDEVIAAIRESSSSEQARQRLQGMLGIDELQAQAVLDLKLQKLTGMELDSIRQEHAEVAARIATLDAIISSPQRIRQIITDELVAIRERYGIERRTEIGHGLTDITREDLIPREDVLLTLTQGGYVKRLPANALERQNRGTRGKRALDVAEDDAIAFLQQCHSHDSLLVFARSGQAYGIRAFRVPEGSLTQRGRHIRNVIDGMDEEVHAVLALPERDPALSVMTITRAAQVKRSSVEDYEGATRRGGIIGVGLDDGDELVAAFAVRQEDHVVLINNVGNAIRFSAEDVRVMGRSAGGVRGMKLDEGEFIVGAAVIPGGVDDGLHLLCAGKLGVGKRTPLSEFPLQSRAGSGVIAFKPNAKTGELVCAMAVRPKDDLVLLASNGVSNRIHVDEVRETGRAASGVILLSLDTGASLVSVTCVVRTSDDEAQPGAAGSDGAPAG